METELVVPGHLTPELAGQVARIRSLTATPTEDEMGETALLGEETARGFITIIWDLIDRGREQVGIKGLKG